MKADIENYRYICECGYQIIWINAPSRKGEKLIYA